MSDFSYYDIPPAKYKRLFAAYLQTDGTQVMNNVQLYYDVINNYKNKAVEFWRLFDIDYLEDLYVKWKESTKVNGVYLDDNEWIFTGFVENICKSYQITREYYSIWAKHTINVATGLPWEEGSVLLNNLHMLRLLKIRRAAIGFDGSRESLAALLNNTLNNRFRNDTENEIRFVMQTQTNAIYHAQLQVYIIRPESANILWTAYDDYLVQDGEYFVQLLGISVEFEVINSDTLVYDVNKYDENEYK